MSPFSHLVAATWVQINVKVILRKSPSFQNVNMTCSGSVYSVSQFIFDKFTCCAHIAISVQRNTK